MTVGMKNSEIQLHNSLVASGTNFMLSTWHHNDFRKNEYIDTIWSECFKLTTEHFYHVGAKEKNRNPMVEALLTNYKFNENKKRLNNTYEQLALPFFHEYE